MNNASQMRQLTLHTDKMLEPLLEQITDDDTLSEIVRFFLIFSLFEYSLKEAGFLKNTSYADLDWHTFSNHINAELSSINGSEDLTEAINYLYENPPKIQTVVVNESGAKSLSAETVTPQGNKATKLTQYIKRIRNNLFHGGKIPFDTSRDTKLLKSPTTILTYPLKLDSAISVIKCYEQGGHFWSTNHLKS